MPHRMVIDGDPQRSTSVNTSRRHHRESVPRQVGGPCIMSARIGKAGPTWASQQAGGGVTPTLPDVGVVRMRLANDVIASLTLLWVESLWKLRTSGLGRTALCCHRQAVPWWLGVWDSVVDLQGWQDDWNPGSGQVQIVVRVAIRAMHDVPLVRLDELDWNARVGG